MRERIVCSVVVRRNIVVIYIFFLSKTSLQEFCFCFFWNYSQNFCRFLFFKTFLKNSIFFFSYTITIFYLPKIALNVRFSNGETHCCDLDFLNLTSLILRDNSPHIYKKNLKFKCSRDQSMLYPRLTTAGIRHPSDFNVRIIALQTNRIRFVRKVLYTYESIKIN